MACLVGSGSCSALLCSGCAGLSAPVGLGCRECFGRGEAEEGRMEGGRHEAGREEGIDGHTQAKTQQEQSVNYTTLDDLTDEASLGLR